MENNIFHFFAQKIKNNWHRNISFARLSAVNYGKNYKDSVQCSHRVSPVFLHIQHYYCEWLKYWLNEKWKMNIYYSNKRHMWDKVLWQKILTALCRTQSILSVIGGIKFLFRQLSQFWTWRIICLFLMSFLNLTICSDANHVIRIKL